MNGIEVKKNFALRPKLDAKVQDAKLRDAAKMYEKQFLREMMKAMKNTVKHSEFSKPGYAENIYQNQLDNQYAEKWGDTGGIGLADLIYEQIRERYFNNKNIQKPNGPIPLDQKPKFLDNTIQKAIPIEVKPSGDNELGYIIHPSKFEAVETEVKSPWSGELGNIFASNGHNFLEVKHDQGLNSLIGFSGQLGSGLQTGQLIGDGQQLGLIKDINQPLYWKLFS